MFTGGPASVTPACGPRGSREPTWTRAGDPGLSKLESTPSRPILGAMEALVVWMKEKWFEIPHWAWLGLALYAMLEKILGNSKNAQINSALDAISSGLALVLVPILSRIPVAGPIAIQVLRAIRVLPPETPPAPKVATPGG